MSTPVARPNRALGFHPKSKIRGCKRMPDSTTMPPRRLNDVHRRRRRRPARPAKLSPRVSPTPPTPSRTAPSLTRPPSRSTTAPAAPESHQALHLPAGQEDADGPDPADLASHQRSAEQEPPEASTPLARPGTRPTRQARGRARPDRRRGAAGQRPVARPRRSPRPPPARAAAREPSRRRRSSEVHRRRSQSPRTDPTLDAERGSSLPTPRSRGLARGSRPRRHRPPPRLSPGASFGDSEGRKGGREAGPAARAGIRPCRLRRDDAGAERRVFHKRVYNFSTL